MKYPGLLANQISKVQTKASEDKLSLYTEESKLTAYVKKILKENPTESLIDDSEISLIKCS